MQKERVGLGDEAQGLVIDGRIVAVTYAEWCGPGDDWELWWIPVDDPHGRAVLFGVGKGAREAWEDRWDRLEQVQSRSTSARSSLGRRPTLLSAEITAQPKISADQTICTAIRPAATIHSAARAPISGARGRREGRGSIGKTRLRAPYSTTAGAILPLRPSRRCESPTSRAACPRTPRGS
jgi:hypothetical protein